MSSYLRTDLPQKGQKFGLGPLGGNDKDYRRLIAFPLRRVPDSTQPISCQPSDSSNALCPKARPDHDKLTASAITAEETSKECGLLTNQVRTPRWTYNGPGPHDTFDDLAQTCLEDFKIVNSQKGRRLFDSTRLTGLFVGLPCLPLHVIVLYPDTRQYMPVSVPAGNPVLHSGRMLLNSAESTSPSPAMFQRLLQPYVK